MPPPMQNFRGPGNSLANHYAGYPSHSQAHNAGLPPPSIGGNPGFMNANSMNSAFAVNGNALSMSGGFGNTTLGMAGGTGLASQAAQMSFAGASSQQLALHNGMGEGRPHGNKGRIREVWKTNLNEEMALLRQLVDRYPYVAMDTEFPGVVARPMGGFSGKSDYHYQCVRVNVDMLKLIQIGITLFNEDGETPPASVQEAGVDLPQRFRGRTEILPHTWQFNFKFSLTEDMSSSPSIESLQQAGVDFAGHEQNGIEHKDFASLLISSGLVCDEDVKWISFHGGYDFAYTTKILRCLPLPDDEQAFDLDIKKFFPSIVDIKYLMKQAISKHMRGELTPLDPSTAEVLAKFEQRSGLEGLAESLKIKRQGTAHNAGSDSLLTGRVFFKIREKVFNGEIGEELIGQVWGLMGAGAQDYRLPTGVQSTPRQYNPQLQQQENATPNQNGYTNGAPSTPNTSNARLAGTPNNANARGIQPMTPGGGGGAFGEFTYNAR